MAKRGNLAELPGGGLILSLYEYVVQPTLEWLQDNTRYLRERFQENQMLTLGVTLAVIVIAVGAIVYQLKPAGSSNISNRQTWYYDLNTNKLFTDKAIQLPPIATSSGDFEGEPAGVRALVFVDTNGDRHIAWLEKYSVEAKAAMEKQLEMATTGEIDYEIETAIESGRMIKRPDDATWVSEMSMEAQEIREELMQKAANEGWRVHQPK